ncbi:MFS transporter [Nocardiopsis rhodophaea]
MLAWSGSRRTLVAMKSTNQSTQYAPLAGRREWAGLAVLMLPVLLIAMSVTILNFALPRLSAELEPSSAQLLWIMDIYTFLLAGLLVTMGTLGDRIGRRRLLMLGAVAFGIASLASAFATSPEMLIASRALLGIGGATLMPATLALIRNMFVVPRQRQLAIGLWTAGFIAGTAVGPLAGGILLEFFWWGSVFLVNVPIMLLLLVAGPILLPEYRDPNAGRFDLVSAALSLAAVLPVIYGVKKLSEDGFGWSPVVAIVVGLAIGGWVVLRQLRLPDPLIDVRLFRSSAFSASLITVMLGVFALVGFMLFVSQYLQLVLGLRPIMAGVWMLPMVTMSAVGSVLSVVLAGRIRPAYVVGGALLIGAAGMTLLTRIGPDTPIALLLVGVGMVGAGMGSIAALCTDLVVASAPSERAGAASSLSETAGELGGALGIAIMGSIGMAIYRADMMAGAPADVPDEVVDAAHETLPGAVAVAERLPEALATPLLDVAFQAFTDGMRMAAGSAAVILAAAAVMVLFTLRHVPVGGVSGHGPGDDTESAGEGSDDTAIEAVGDGDSAPPTAPDTASRP